MSETVIGIDLGTTNSCVYLYKNNRLKVLENNEGGRVTPSYIFFTEQSAIVGQYAKRMADAKPEYGIYEIKRLVGRKYDDPYVKNNLNYLPFQVKNISNEPAIIIQGKNQIIKKSPQDLCTCILKKLKTDAENKLGHKVEKAVITVPAYFNVSQREVTLAAANNAGFTVLKLLNEPTAAALSYYHENSCEEKETFSLVYDLGGGTFDVAVLRRQDSNIDILGVDGDTHLGGHDFDNSLVEHVCQILINKYSYNPKNDKRNMRRLNNECEEAKKILSIAEETTIILNGFLADANPIEIPITRKEFEKMCEACFTKTIEIVDRCLKKVNLTKNDIKDVILCGGSTRIPKLQKMICDYFNGKTLNKFVNPDECVAEGAALQAAMLSKDHSQQITNIKITDVTPLSLGISNFVDLMTFLIVKNTPIPTSATTKRITVYDKQTNMSFDIYEGERANAKKNHYLGMLEISALTPAPPGQCSVSVTMSIDQNSILKVSATETVSNKTKDVKIVYTRGCRSDMEVKNLLEDASANEEEDESFRKFAEVKAYVLKFCIRAIYNFEQRGLTGTCIDVFDRCTDLIREVKIMDMDKEKELVKIKHEVVKLCEPFIKKYNFSNMP